MSGNHKVLVLDPRSGADGKVHPFRELEPSRNLTPSQEPAPAVTSGVTSEIQAMIFADVKHFSQLTEEQIPGFLTSFIGPLSEMVRDTFPPPLFQNTWGDGFFFVFSSIGGAGRFALRLQDCVAKIDRVAVNLPPDLILRIALHAGPVFRFHDQLIDRDNFMGSHVNRAARIEPVTPEGRIYATDSFAALATLYAPGQFRFTYAGKIPLAKNFGRFSLYDVTGN
jgi:class 3 adenylate cyclase